MKRIINGKKYDTDTAKELGYWSNGYPCGDFNWLFETLYLKKTGEYFLVGEGGALTKYSNVTYNGSTDGVKFMPMSEDDAKEWAERRLTCDEYEKIFGEVEE